MEKLTSNKTLLYTLIAAGVVILLVTIGNIQANRKKTMKQDNKDQVKNEQVIPAPETSMTGDYSTIMTSASGTKVVALNIEDGKVTLTNMFANGEPNVSETGTYEQDGNLLKVKLATLNGEEIASPKELEFAKEANNLVLKNSEQAGYGTEGLTLSKTASELSKTSWYWTHTQMNDGQKTTPQSPRQFNLQFLNQIDMSTTTDCNTGSGTYYTSGTAIYFGPMATTMMYCENAMEPTYLSQLREVNSYKIDGDNLILMLPYDSGSMVFEKATE